MENQKGVKDEKTDPKQESQEVRKRRGRCDGPKK